jgi:hypothetical protein
LAFVFGETASRFGAVVLGGLPERFAPGVETPLNTDETFFCSPALFLLDLVFLQDLVFLLELVF